MLFVMLWAGGVLLECHGSTGLRRHTHTHTPLRHFVLREEGLGSGLAGELTGAAPQVHLEKDRRA